MMGKGIFVALVAIALVLPSVAAKDHTCGPYSKKDDKCDVTLAKGEKFTLDCSNQKTTVPVLLLDGDSSKAKICSDTKARTKVGDACGGSEVTFDSLKSKNLTFTASATGFSVTNKDYKESSDMYLTGSCADNATAAQISKSGYFNITLKSGASSSAYSRVGLAAATSIALLAMAAF